MVRDNRDWLRTQMPRKPNGEPNPVAKSVLVALANYANREGTCWPSQDSLSEFTGWGETAISSALGVLEEQGYITRKRRGPRAGATFGGTDYRLNLERPEDDLTRNVPQPAGLAAAGKNNHREVDARGAQRQPTALPKTTKKTSEGNP